MRKTPVKLERTVHPWYIYYSELGTGCTASRKYRLPFRIDLSGTIHFDSEHIAYINPRGWGKVNGRQIVHR